MQRQRTILTGRLLAMSAALAAATLAFSACSSSGSGSGGSGASSSAPTATQASSGAVVSTTTGPDGTYLSNSAGRAIYLWVADTSTKSTCTGACAAAWPPVTTHGQPQAAGEARAKLLGTTKRADGSLQVTYAGHPLYFYAGDSGKATDGQGLDTYGALWWLVDRSGKAITTTAGAGTTSTPAGNGPYGY